MTVRLIPWGVGQAYEGLSTDDKPTGVQINSTFREQDTGLHYITYDGTVWVEKKSESSVSEDAIVTAIGTPTDTDIATDIANVQSVVDLIGAGGDATEAKQDIIIAKTNLIPTTLDHLMDLDGATQKYPENLATDSILAKILVDTDPAVPSGFDNSLMSLEALYKLLAAIPTTAMRGTDSAALASVLGALNDAAAEGAVTTTDTLMAYQKQIVTALLAALTSSDIQAAALAAQRDIMGGGTPGYARQAIKAPVSVATGDLFTTTGVVKILQIGGTVTTQLEVTSFTLRLDFNPDAGGAQYLCAVSVDCSGFAAGTAFGITGTVGDAMIEADGISVIDGQSVPKDCHCVTSGKIHLTASAAATGVIQWHVLWVPVTPGATLVAA